MHEKILKQLSRYSPVASFLTLATLSIEFQLEAFENIIITFNAIIFHLWFLSYCNMQKSFHELESMRYSLNEISKHEIKSFSLKKLSEYSERNSYFKIHITNHNKITLNDVSTINSSISCLYSNATKLTRIQQISQSKAEKEIVIEGVNNGSLIEYFSGNLKDYLLTGTTLSEAQISESNSNEIKNKVEILILLKESGLIREDITNSEFDEYIDSKDLVTAIKNIRNCESQISAITVYDSDAKILLHKDKSKKLLINKKV